MTDVLRLFLVEDNDNIALIIRRSLERVGHHVTACRTAADALIVLGQSTFDLVLLDQKLPDMTGLELLYRLGRERAATPVLMVTGEGNETIATQALQAGALDYIVKDGGLLFLADLPKRVAESVRRYKLENTNRLLVQALESARDGVMITDLQGVILEVNHALVALTGYARHELIGQTPRLLRSGVHTRDFYQKMWQTVLARGSWQGELTNRRKDGNLVVTSMTISPIVDDHGRLTHFVGIQRDISEHKQLERALLQMQKMQSVGTLAGGIAHEFNNLMAGINGYASLGLRENDVPPTLRDFFQFIVDLSDRAANLTRQLLAFARKPALTKRRTPLVELLRATAELVARTLHQTVELDLPDPADHAGLFVEADANQLQQALVNLALNGRDALLERAARDAHRGGGHLGVPTEPLNFRLRAVTLDEAKPSFPQPVPSGDYLRIQVQDRGVGMSPDVIGQALDPFFTTKDVGQGTGLGLPMVYGIVQGHQGFLTLDSEPGVGSTVGLYLPRPSLTGPKSPPPLITEHQYVEPEPSARHDILVIDDEQAVLDIVRRFLEIAGHHVRTAGTARQAEALLSSGPPPDLVILDLMMPDDDPHGLFDLVRRHAAEVPVLLCTGLADSDPAPRLLARPNTSLIRKPFRMNELWYAVRQLVGDAVSGEG